MVDWSLAFPVFWLCALLLGFGFRPSFGAVVVPSWCYFVPSVGGFFLRWQFLVLFTGASLALFLRWWLVCVVCWLGVGLFVNLFLDS